MTGLLLGLGLGLAAGISPGPLLFLVIAITLRHGLRAGVIASLAPLVTDLVVVAGVLVVLDHVNPLFLTWLGLIGSGVVLYSALTTIRQTRDASLERPAEQVGEPPATGWRAFGEAFVVNVTSPHPWLAWATVMGPLTLRTYQQSPIGAVAFVGGFYLALVAVKVALAFGVSGAGRRLTSRGYQRALFASGILLAAVGVVMFVGFGLALVSGTPTGT